MLLVYCRSHKRRPILLGYKPIFRDIQAQIPLAWCESCGAEVFEIGQQRCPRCRPSKGEGI